MYKTIYPSKDSTIYERHSERNTGVDQILELTKVTAGAPIEDILSSGQTWETTYNSRILLKFDLNRIQTDIADGKIYGAVQYFLTLKATEATELPIDYTLMAYPISGSWTNGTGYYNNNPEVKNGVSWACRDANGTLWNSGSFIANATSSYVSVPGGGAWFTGSGFEASQSFSYESPDIRMNVTDIINKWLSGSIENEGFLIKHTALAESDSSILGSIKLFSKDTHTIYIPRLEIYWNDYDQTGTGSYTAVTDDDFIVYLKNLNDTYHDTEKPKIRISVRDRYPVKTYATSSNYVQQLRLPEDSFFAIYDYATDEPVIDFHEFTKINCDSLGNYIKLNMESFLPERYYKILLKVNLDSDNTKIIDDGFYFKVKRA